MNYLYKPDAKEPYTTDFVVEVYGLKEHRIYDYDTRFEKSAYASIWAIPLVLMFPFVLQELGIRKTGNIIKKRNDDSV